MIFVYFILIMFAPVRHYTFCKRRLKGEIDNSIGEITVCYLVYGFISAGLAFALTLNWFGPSNCGAAGGGALVLAFMPTVFFMPMVAIRSLVKINSKRNSCSK